MSEIERDGEREVVIEIEYVVKKVREGGCG